MRGAYALLVGLICFLPAAPGVSQVTVTPTEIDDLLANPNMGWQTFHRFADDDPALEGLPSTSAYFRLYWSRVEPVEGEIDFAKLDDLLARAHNTGQKLAFRIMCAGTDAEYMHVPEWLKDKGCPGFEFEHPKGGRKHWVPDMDHPIFQEAHFRLIEELGARYDGHADFDLLDIGSVGLWGEWHMSGTGVDMPTQETRRAIIDAWCEAFPTTPKVMLIGDADGMTYATGKGAGWRADCLGDMGGFSKTWNHMENFYLQQLEKTDTLEAWQTGPVAFESCWSMRKWHDEGWDVRYIFDYAIECHASYLNNKSAPIPEGTRPEIERFLRKIGYRLILRKLEHPESIEPGSSLPLAMTWENVGCAPPYRDHLLAIRLSQEGGGEARTIVSDVSVKEWLPGERAVEMSPELPRELVAGRYELAIAIVDPLSQEPTIRLAIDGGADDGWYPLTHIEVKAN